PPEDRPGGRLHMFKVEVITGSRTQRVDVPDDAVVGRGRGCEVRLDSWRISKEHARLYRTPSGVIVEDVGGMGGVYVNGKRVPQFGPLSRDDRIDLGPFRLFVIDDARPATHRPAPAPR